MTREVIRDAGRLAAIQPASNHIPPVTKVVTMDQWRDYAYRRGISTSGQPRAQQLAPQKVPVTSRPRAVQTDGSGLESIS